ncbi:MAG: DUF669 domain-containing protein [Clostridia bacterium]|nr:DUF669 domain-containing protein [Clostridia bacterium]
MTEKNIWDQFDSAIDTKALADEVKNSADSPSYREVPEGTYEVAVEKLELIASRNNKPMGTIWFKVLTGEYKGSRIFYNQVLEQPFQIHMFNKFLRSLDSGLDVKFTSYRQYGELLMNIAEAIDKRLEYALVYEKNNKGYPTFEIEEIFEVE